MRATNAKDQIAMRAELEMKYVHHWVDHLGRNRYRFRRRGCPGVELPCNGDPSSIEFQAAYHLALRGEKTNAAVVVAAARAGSGTVATAVETYLDSVSFRDGSELSTQNLRRPILRRFLRPGIAELPLNKMDEAYILRWLERAPTLGARNTRLNALRPFFAWCVNTAKLITVDPTEGIKKSKVVESDGHWVMQPEEIEQYRAYHGLGTMARKALELGLTVLTRRGDCISIGPQHIKHGGTWLEFTAEKNRRRKPTLISIPLPPELAEAIATCPSPDALTLLTNQWGKPFTRRSFNTAFREWCKQAGLDERVVPHSMRKGGSKRMADSGCNELELMAQGGWHTSKEVQRYTRDYDRKQAAIRAAAKLAAPKDNVIPLTVAAKR